MAGKMPLAFFFFVSFPLDTRHSMLQIFLHLYGVLNFFLLGSRWQVFLQELPLDVSDSGSTCCGFDGTGLEEING